MSVKSIESFSAHYAGMLACIEIQDVETKCNPVLDSDIVFDELPQGHHTVRAFITDDMDHGAHRHLTEAATFAIVSTDEFDEYSKEVVQRRQEELELPRDWDILTWAQQQQDTGDKADKASSSGEADDVQLVIGVKTAVLSNFPRRQAIRETWGDKRLCPKSRFCFLVAIPTCLVSTMRDIDSSSEMRLR